MEKRQSTPSVGQLLQRLGNEKTMRERFDACARVKKHGTVEILHQLISDEVNKRGREVILSPELPAIENKIADWLLGTGKPWLMLCGNVGDGKTTVLNAIQRFITLYDIEKPARGGRLSEYWRMSIVQAHEYARAYVGKLDMVCYYENCDILGLDDMGAEPAETLVYGNPTYPIVDLLLARYARDKQVVITTNLKANEIRPRYGDRIADRLNEMCERVIFPISSYR